MEIKVNDIIFIDKLNGCDKGELLMSVKVCSMSHDGWLRATPVAIYHMSHDLNSINILPEYDVHIDWLAEECYG